MFPQARWTDARATTKRYDEHRNLDPGRAGAWLHTVVKREAKALRRSRQKLVGSEEFDADGQEAPPADARGAAAQLRHGQPLDQD